MRHCDVVGSTLILSAINSFLDFYYNRIVLKMKNDFIKPSVEFLFLFSHESARIFSCIIILYYLPLSPFCCAVPFFIIVVGIVPVDSGIVAQRCNKRYDRTALLSRVVAIPRGKC